MKNPKPKLMKRISQRGHLVNKSLHLVLEVSSRVALFIVFCLTEGEKAVPCIRSIRPEELWLYKYPRRDSYVPTWMLWVEVFTVGPVIFTLIFLYTKNRKDLLNAFMSYSLACLLNGAIVNIVKVCAGRPRPDFFYRCFPVGGEHVEWSDDITCDGLTADIVEGRKSFPSGHSSWSFTVMTWAFLYVSGKLQTFSVGGEGRGWKLSLSLLPLVIACCIAISRTCDNHHHWQDVAVGTLLGIGVAYAVYRVYYPALHHKHCELALEELHHHHPVLSPPHHPTFPHHSLSDSFDIKVM